MPISTKAPFDPNKTTVRAASITKTLTATAIMQLAEQRKLDPVHNHIFPTLTSFCFFRTDHRWRSAKPIALVLMKLPFDIQPKKIILSAFIIQEIPARVAPLTRY
ncbi:MAG: hypothetical protein U0401_27915 [Anaerolineae bacterium]